MFHVNGDDPEACLRAMQLAFDYRQRFHSDVVIDMVCYRKHGHNEGDDASYTQPIHGIARSRRRRPVTVAYAARLAQEGVVTAEEVAGWQEAQKKRLYEIYDQTQKNKEEYELQELSPIPRRGHARRSVRPPPCDRAVIGPDSRRHHHVSGRFQAPSQAGRVGRAAARGPQRRTAHRLGAGGDTGLRQPGAGRHAGAPERPGLRARHLQPAPRRISRRRRPAACTSPLAAFGARLRRDFEVYNSPLSEYARGGLRIRLQRGRSLRAGAVGGAVRRFRQRRADHHRPVHFLGRIEMGPAQRHW